MQGDGPILFVSTGFAGTLSPRLILNIRREYYGETDSSQAAGTRSLSWAAATGRGPAMLNASGETNGSSELTSSN